MEVLKVEKLTKKFGNFEAVRDVDFSIEDNKVIGFLGPNGAGKTTIIRMLVGLSKPTSGKITILGKNYLFGETPNRTVGYLPEQVAFYPWMTGKEYLRYIADIYQIPSEEVLITQLLSKVGLKDKASRRIGGYSNGMKQRLGIAQALINDPKILILDEPVSALDPIGRREVLEIINELKKSKTIFFSTHILSDVDKICDKVIIINQGQIAAISDLTELKEKYAKPILEVEFKRNPNSLVTELKNENWVRRVEQNKNLIKVWLNSKDIIDDEKALKMFLKFDLGILKYGLILPEAEDLFMEIIGEQK